MVSLDDMNRNSEGQFVKVPTKNRFWSKVNKKGPWKCWEWMGAKRKDGYGVVWHGGKIIRAHRFVVKEFNPEIKVSHRCDNPCCVNPRHLFKGTQVDNLMDMKKKKRGSSHFYEKGTKNPKAKFSLKEVEEIRSKYVPYKYSQCRLAREYGVVQQTISKIIKYQRYE